MRGVGGHSALAPACVRAWACVGMRAGVLAVCAGVGAHSLVLVWRIDVDAGVMVVADEEMSVVAGHVQRLDVGL